MLSHHAQQQQQRQAHEHHHDNEHVHCLQHNLVLLDAVEGSNIVLQLCILSEYIEPPWTEYLAHCLESGEKREKHFPEKHCMMQNTSIFCDDELTAHPKYT